MTAGYQPNFDIDRAWGEVAEGSIRALLNDPLVEVKRKSRVDDRFYVETCQLVSGAVDYKRSGVNTSTAEYWAFDIAGTGVIVMVPRQRLKDAARDGAPVPGGLDGDNPTKGRLVTFKQMLMGGGPA